MRTFEEEMNRILTNIGGGEGHEEDTKPLLEKQEPLETYDIYPVPGGMVILKREEEEPIDNQVIDTTEDHKRSDVLAFITCLISTLLLLYLVTNALFLTFFPPIITVTLMLKGH